MNFSPDSAVTMQPIPYQQTIAHIARVSGRGYWSGEPVTVSLLPAATNTGIVFRRVDLTTRPSIPALASYRVDTNLRTRLECHGVSVEMVEHVMAALYGMQIDNCIVECDGSEMPGMDGSALPFALAIQNAGVTVQSELAEVLTIEDTLSVGDTQCGVLATPSGSPGLSMAYHLDFGPSSPIPSSSSMFEINANEFINSIAPARTFLSESDAKELQRRGIASHVTYRDLLVFGTHGPIDNTLHFLDECSRHKLLDLVGDIALCGVRIHGVISAHRSGHNLNGRLAERLMAMHASRERHWSRAA